MDDTQVKEIEARVETELRVKLEAQYAEKLAKRLAEVDEENNRVIAQALEEWQVKQNKVKLTPEELDKLLSQEYASFTVKVPGENGETTFTLIELPQAIEKRFYRVFRDKLKPHMAKLATIVKDVEAGRVEGKIETILDLFEPAFDILVSATCIVLNPFGKKEEITEDWVANNLSSSRMLNILMAQEHLNKLRSFFSRVSPLSLGGQGT